MSLKVYYHSNPIRPQGVAQTITDKPIEELIRYGVIKEGEPYIVTDYIEDPTNEQYLQMYYIDFLRFDDPVTPTEILVDLEAAALHKTEQIREARTAVLQELDRLQIRAIAMSKFGVGMEIEKDKQKLRDLPDHLDFSHVHSLLDIEMFAPPELFIDYSEKYRDALKM